MNDLEKDAMNEYRRDVPQGGFTWKHWVIFAIVSWMAYVFATGLKTILS